MTDMLEIQTADDEIGWLQNIEAFMDQDALVTGQWGSWQGGGGGGDDGRAVVCWLSAIGPDIRDDGDVPCAAMHMPDWMAPLIRTLFDGMDDVREFYDLAAPAMRGWRVLNDAAWKRVSLEIRAQTVEMALGWAEQAQPTPRPDYWDAVQTACGEMAAALRSGDQGRIYAKAAEAAWAAGAARAAEAAGAAGAARAAGAAGAAWAARAAGAAGAAWAARAAWAAWADACGDIATALFGLIQAEIDAANGVKK